MTSEILKIEELKWPHGVWNECKKIQGNIFKNRECEALEDFENDSKNFLHSLKASFGHWNCSIFKIELVIDIPKPIKTTIDKGWYFLTFIPFIPYISERINN